MAMRRIDTVVVGGSQAGLAMSRCLAERGVEHVVLERGRIGERWRSERWNSLHLLTPRWQSRLPGFHYRGPDPHGYMSKDELVGYLESYAASFSAPVEEDTVVLGLEAEAGGYRVSTRRGAWSARAVVIATGHSDKAFVPSLAAGLPTGIVQVVPTRYREPSQLPAGGVLVVGASAAGVQLAEEVQLSGRPVTLAVGRHTRLPRLYRGRDILAWLDAMGILDERAEEVRDLERSKRQPSYQLAGRADRGNLDLGVLRRLGVRLVGSVIGASGGRVEVGTDLAAWMAQADDKLSDLLDRVDRFIGRAGLGAEVGGREAVPALLPPPAPRSIELAAEGIRTVVWATGYRRDYAWLRVPVLDERGEIRHRHGVTEAPGLYVLGLRFQTRRNSSFLDGVGADAAELAEHLATRRRAAA
jgi:putative flavoprotein involved in K+ transport